jgi:hypothetical protein
MRRSRPRVSSPPLPISASCEVGPRNTIVPLGVSEAHVVSGDARERQAETRGSGEPTGRPGSGDEGMMISGADH